MNQPDWLSRRFSATVVKHLNLQQSFDDLRISHSIVKSIPPNLLRTMISRSAIGRNAQLALRRQCCAQPANKRGLAVSVSGSTSFSYDTADVGGVKVASRDVAGPTTKLAVIAKAGTRYQSLPAQTAGLEQFAFKVRRRCTDGEGDLENQWLIVNCL